MYASIQKDCRPFTIIGIIIGAKSGSGNLILRFENLSPHIPSEFAMQKMMMNICIPVFWCIEA